MMIDLLKEIILDFQRTPLETGIPRQLEYDLVPGKAFVCIGVRRCGKSTLLYQIIDGIEKQAGTRDNVLYLNFFDDRLSELYHGGLGTVLDAYYALYPGKKGAETVYCFFDEIQMTKDWEPFVDRILRTEKCEVFLTGSSATMLAREIATQMRGRSLAWELFPFSFREFLTGKGVSYSELTSQARASLHHAFDEYWQAGGFPEVLGLNERVRRMIHQEYFKAVLHRDIVERHDAQHPQAVLDMGYRIINNIASLHSINRLTEYLKSLGHRFSKSFVSDCLRWFEDAYFLFPVLIYDSSQSRQHANPRKMYCVDHSLVTSVSSGIMINSGHLLENLAFVHLRRKSPDVYYYRTNSGKEVDFLWVGPDGDRHLVQVSETLAAPETRQRELASLTEAMRELGLEEGSLVTRNESELIQTEDRTITVVPAWQFLLD